MIELEKAYEAQKFEDLIYEKWLKSGHFTPKVDPGKKPFTISLPPPNATGTLHLGHATMLAIQDIIIRHKRMQGYSTLWLPGTDHAAIATQSVVEKLLQKKGIARPRVELGREKLIEEIKKYVEESKQIIKNQICKMGASVDWSREKYTLDDDLNHAVNTFFSRMFNDGLIYHGDRIVNWDPKMQTTVADDELEYKEEKARFYYLQYGPVIIATARPETKFADKVIVVNPSDKRYKHLIGKEFTVEWINGPIKARVIADKCVDPKLGTGAMTITPAHSLIDFDLAEKHKLEKEQIIDFEGKLLPVAGEFAGMTIENARPLIVEKLRKKGLMIKVDENYLHNIAVSYRGKGVIEPQIMKQWFVDVNKKAINWKGKSQSIKEVLRDTVTSGMIKIVPKRFEKIYFHWIDNLLDWCLSRQIWWGHRIPIWYEVSAEDKKKWLAHPEASSYLLQVLKIKIHEVKFSETAPAEKGDWIQDPDTLDTWFSSALWTFSTLGWPAQTEDFKFFHPTDVLETGYDILFFWVARMILASTYCLRSDNLPEEQCIPFKNVYLHGLIRDINGKKMSKSNPETCIDPLEMIAKYGTDAVRLSLVIGNTPGNDMRLYEEKIAGYRNFVNKIWNASRFALMNVPDLAVDTKNIEKHLKNRADRWIVTRLQKLVKEVNNDLNNYRFSDAATKIYDFTWGQYCDWYLEISKGDRMNAPVLLYVLKTLLKLLHPFVPFVTEAIWSNLGESKLLIGESWPKYSSKLVFTKDEKEMEVIQSLITTIRSIRAENKIEPARKINATIYCGKWTALISEMKDSVLGLARLENVEIKEKGAKLPRSIWKFFNDINVYLPIEGLFDIAKETERLKNKIIETEQKMKGLIGRLENQAFLSRAPKEVVAKEKEIFLDLETELTNLQNKINELESL
jgi:valyl-tRNA synthetase